MIHVLCVLSRNQTLRSAGSRTVQLPCFVDTRLRNKKGDRGNMKSVRPECIGQRPGRPHLLMGHNMVWTSKSNVQCLRDFLSSSVPTSWNNDPNCLRVHIFRGEARKHAMQQSQRPGMPWLYTELQCSSFRYHGPELMNPEEYWELIPQEYPTISNIT